MIFEKIDKLIAEAMHKNNALSTSLQVDEVVVLNTLRAIKTEMTNEIHNGSQLNDNVEITILTRMKKRRTESAEIYKKVGEVERAQIEEQEIKVIDQFLPTTPKAEDVIDETRCVTKTFIELKSIEDPGFDVRQLQRFTRDIIAKVKEKFPMAEAGLIAKTIKEFCS